MEAFVWDDRLTTGLETVDTQHRHLVDIVNQVGDVLLDLRQTTPASLQEFFKQLAAYAQQHFADEEQLMAATGVDERHRQSHTRHHQQFVEQLVAMWKSRDKLSHPAATLHDFLAAWLTFHIIGEDMAMARQIAAIRQGVDAQTAYAREEGGSDRQGDILLSALHKLYHLLSLQNRDLAEANQALEAKVAERTQDLTAANSQLDRERSELQALVKKLEAAQNQLLQSEKMATIGQLAAGVAHEINNPIGFVSSNLGTLKNYTADLLTLVDAYRRHLTSLDPGSSTLPADLQAAEDDADLDYLRDDLPALLHESEDGLARVKKIVRDLKDFSHVDESEWQEADLNAGLDSTLNVVWNELKYKCEVVKDYQALPLVRCLAAQINQVFMNLLINAGQAIAERGTITLATRSDGDWVSIAISDTGCGMTAEVAHRVFEPFYTTKPVGKGTGLGLSLSWDIVVNKHGGRIEIDSTPGQGTTFRVSLPVAGKDPQ